jgi:hypothetical protein
MRRTPSIVETNGRPWAVLSFSLLGLGLLGMVGLAGRRVSNAPTVVTPAHMSAAQVVLAPGSDQVKEYSDEAPKTVVELQQFRQTSSIPIRSATGREGSETLINLDPAINTWFILRVAWNGLSEMSYHLENPAPLSQKLVLDEHFRSGIVIEEGQARHPCSLFEGAPVTVLDQASKSQSIFASLCDSRLYLRNRAKGQRTALEAATEFLRSQVWGGEKVIVLFHHLLKDTNRETGKIQTEATNPGGKSVSSSNLPTPARIDPQYANRVISSGDLGIAVEGADSGGLRPGSWYAASGNPGVSISLIQPNFIDPTILKSYRASVNNLDGVEASSLCYLVAFDLDEFDLAYELGTEYPGVGWSERITPKMKDPKLPGPDGIGSISPLVGTGLINPLAARKAVATFTAGFKREHGAFRSGAFAQINHGSHYGFIEDGVVLSKLQPGLATILVPKDGRVQMKTWEIGDNKLLADLKYARQNGVPLVEYDERLRSTVPGALVSRWGPGNWSGSEDMKLRTIRAGIGLQERAGKRFLVYAVFSDATPSAMARVFQAYQSKYALLLDMNALEHTYLALYRRSGQQLFVDHLIQGMGQVEKSAGGEVVPRFLGYPDNRDFFYLTRRNP